MQQRFIQFSLELMGVLVKQAGSKVGSHIPSEAHFHKSSLEVNVHTIVDDVNRTHLLQEEEMSPCHPC